MYGRPVAGRDQKANYDVDIYTIIFLALAVFIFLRLRSVLGQRTGSERPPYDRAAPNVVQRTQDNNNVVPMPGAVIDQAPLAPTADVAPTDRWKDIAEPGTPLAAGLDGIAAQDSSFDPRHFLSGARSAYEMIVLAFANGDRRALNRGLRWLPANAESARISIRPEASSPPYASRPVCGSTYPTLVGSSRLGSSRPKPLSNPGSSPEYSAS